MARIHPRMALQRPPARDGVAPSSVSTVPGPWATVLDFLAERFVHIDRTTWLQRLRMGAVLDAQGHALEPDAAFAPHQRLYYYREAAPESEPHESETVLFQDEHLVVADKPHGMPVTPSGSHVRQTLLARLRARLGLPTLSPLHRIDRDTAGLVLLSVNPAERNAYQRLFRDHAIHKTYECIAPWAPDLPWPLRRASRLGEGAHFMQQTEVPGEVNAVTTITPIEHLDPAPPPHALRHTHPQAPPHGWARYRLEPLTGQRHQLRVHMNALGLPIAFDGIYPVLTPPGHGTPARPLQLLAQAVAFTDPHTGQTRHYASQRQLLSLSSLAAIAHACS
ncbi:MAG: pseudouridine synthase [Rhodoferax sp.]